MFRQVTSYPHPDPREVREEPDGSEASVRPGEKDDDDHSHLDGPGAGSFTLEEQVDPSVEQLGWEAEQGSGVDAVLAKAGAIREREQRRSERFQREGGGGR